MWRVIAMMAVLCAACVGCVGCDDEEARPTPPGPASQASTAAATSAVSASAMTSEAEERGSAADGPSFDALRVSLIVRSGSVETRVRNEGEAEVCLAAAGEISAEGGASSRRWPLEPGCPDANATITLAPGGEAIRVARPGRVHGCACPDACDRLPPGRYALTLRSCGGAQRSAGGFSWSAAR